MSRLTRFFGDKRGATAVEFAIVAPLIFASVLGTFETGRALYVRNHVSEACAAGARKAVTTASATNDQIESAVLGEFPEYDQANADITVINQTISGKTFKKITVVYTHDFIINFGRELSGLTFTIDRYVPSS
jgi:Flp pilus assembly protein TadG